MFRYNDQKNYKGLYELKCIYQVEEIDENENEVLPADNINATVNMSSTVHRESINDSVYSQGFNEDLFN